ncbi:MAG: hypothetical protein CMJ53_03585, partial [Planctomycetaceae bacterium]|nr:hypothetical protein [Planctomycetaceae bacterium]
MHLMFWLFVVYCSFIALASLLGGFLPLLFKLTHLRMQVALSFISGILLGVGLLHMLPHALAEGAPVSRVVMAFLGGFLLIFFLERFFCFHHHETGDTSDDGHEGHGSHDGHEGAPHGDHTMGWIGTFFGMTIHTLLAGIALGSTVAMNHELQADDSTTETGSVLMGLAGLGTFLAILFHKPFDALTITAVMRVSGTSRARILLVNLLFALVIPLGILLFFFVDGIGTWHNLTAYALAFSAGTFLCIAAADLMPELQFHKHDRSLLSGALIAGLAVAWVSGLFEAHDHGHGHGHGHHHGHAETAGHDHAGHDHSGHDHSGHDHSGHDHSDHDH